MGYAWRGSNTQLVISAPIAVGPQAPGLGTAAAGFSTRGTAKKIVAVTGRCSLPLRSETVSSRRVAQIGRVAAGLAGTSVSAAVLSTGAFSHVVITRDYDLADGDAPTGVVYFTPSAWLVNNGVTVPAAAVPAALDAVGRIAIDLVANTDPGTTPAGSHYTVREAIIGQSERSYRVVIPYNAGSTIDLSTLPVL